MELRVILCIIWACFYLCNGEESTLIIANGKAELVLATINKKLHLTLSSGKSKTNVTLQGELGVDIKKPFNPCVDETNCLESNDVRLHVTREVDEGFTISWTLSDGIAIENKKFEDCFSLNGSEWYGGPERKQQKWPIQELVLENFANVLQEDQSGAVVEPYWLNSHGSYIFVDRKVPLFINQNTLKRENHVCFSAEVKYPYPARDKLVLKYTIVAESDAREAHLNAVHNFLGKPTGHPNVKLIENPIWSTWARYKRDVNDQVLEEFAKEIVDHGYTGQFEIDDNWEECYGALTFSSMNFSQITATVKKIKSYNFTVTLWVHPFVNTDCTTYVDLGIKYGYFVKSSTGNDLTSWWNSRPHSAYHLDFTKRDARYWFVKRLQKLQKDHGIDSFKFDAGESSWVPRLPLLQGYADNQPNNIAEDYVRTCAAFGDLVEVRSAWKTQDLPIFVRMIDKDSKWGVDNGLYTLITTLLQMNINGYTMVLPDMVGGNGYNKDKVDAELFLRWLQANVFMPSIQFSYVPWDFNSTDFDVKNISKHFVDLHRRYAPYIIKQMKRSINEGHPVNAPVWWVAPNSTIAHMQDTQFMMGDDILVAPVIIQGARYRNIYLPFGNWYDPNTETEYVQGDMILTNYSAPINVLPYFLRVGSEVYKKEVASTSNLILANSALLAVILLKAIFNLS